MKKSMSLLFSGIPIQEMKEQQGFEIPWEVKGFDADFEQAETQGGIFDLSHWEWVKISGEDRVDFLHRLSTAEVKKLPLGGVSYMALLTSKAHPIAMGWLIHWGECFLYLIPPGVGNAVIQHLESFHFQEKVEISSANSSFSLVGFWDEKKWNEDKQKKSILPLEPSHSFSPLYLENKYFPFLQKDISIWQDDGQARLSFGILPFDLNKEFFSQATKYGLPLLGLHLFEYYRILRCLPQFGVEISSKDLILESGFDPIIARNKGCYPGQEVVERIFTYGQVNRKLLPIFLSDESGISLPKPPFSVEGEAGKTSSSLQVVSLVFIPKQDRKKGLGFAFVHRNDENTKHVFTLGNCKIEIIQE